MIWPSKMPIDRDKGFFHLKKATKVRATVQLGSRFITLKWIYEIFVNKYKSSFFFDTSFGFYRQPLFEQRPFMKGFNRVFAHFLNHFYRIKTNLNFQLRFKIVSTWENFVQRVVTLKILWRKNIFKCRFKFWFYK